MTSLIPLILLGVPTGNTGSASIKVGVPNNKSLIGGKFANQWVVIDPKGSLWGLLAFSGGGEGLVGGAQ